MIYSVLIVEDEIGIRQLIADHILAHPFLSLFGSVGSCAEAFRCMKSEPDVLLTDLGLPDGSGISLVQQAQEYSEIESIVLTVSGDEVSVVAAIEAGASSYLLKDQAIDGIGDSIFAVLQGESIIDSRVARFLLTRLSKSEPDLPTTKAFAPVDAIHLADVSDEADQDNSQQLLSKREVEVLELVSKGLTYAEIGHVLQISENTIRAHIRNIYGKLTVNSRFEAVYEATVMGLIQPISMPAGSS